MKVNPYRHPLCALQLEKLRALLKTLRGRNAFYASRLPDAAPCGLEEFVATTPLTSRRELVDDIAAHPPHGSRLTFPLANYVRYSQTSGTSGRPMPVLDTAESWSSMLDCWDMVYRAAGVGSGETVFFAFSFGPFLGFWTAFESALRLGIRAIPGGGLSSRARLELLADSGAGCLCCTPTYAFRLAEVAVEEGMDLSRLAVRKIIVAGEPGGSVPAIRRALSEIWNGARVYDHHGLTETGPVSYEHPDHPGVLCVAEAAYFAEILDSDGGEVAEGETGELVLTTLDRVASPLVRYRTGDIVRKRFLPTPWTEEWDAVLGLDGGILGRADDMVVVRGVNIHPSAVESLVRETGGIGEYEVEVSRAGALPEMTVRMEPAGRADDPVALAKALGRGFRDRFGLRVEVIPVAIDSLPRYEFKSKRWKVTS